MLDTNIVSHITRARSQAARSRMLNLKTDEVVCVSAVTEAEIHIGLAKRPGAVALRERMESFLSTVRVLPWVREEAKVYGSLRAKLELSGKTFENTEIQIAAHSIPINAVLVTNNKALAHVNDLQATVRATDL